MVLGVFCCFNVNNLTKLPFIIALDNKILIEINFIEDINSSINWDSNQWKVSPETLAKALILSTFFDKKAAITHVSSRFFNIDC